LASGFPISEEQTVDSIIRQHEEAEASECQNPCKSAVDNYQKETSNSPVFTERPTQDDYKDAVQLLSEQTWNPRRQPVTTCYTAEEVDDKVPTALSVIDNADL